MYTVVGASGFIGGSVSRALRVRGETVFAPERHDQRIFSESLGHVVYCAGVTADFRSRPFDTIRAHVELLSQILERSAFESVLYLSSTRVYSRATSTSEDAPILVQPSEPDDLYNLSKLMGESLVTTCGRPNCRVARLSNVVGIDLWSRNFVFDICRQAIAGEIHLRSNPSSAKDYIHIEDVVDRLIWMTTEARRSCYNIASGRLIPHQAWLDRLVALTGCRVNVEAGSPALVSIGIDVAAMESDFGPARRNVLDELAAIIEALSKEPQSDDVAS